MIKRGAADPVAPLGLRLVDRQQTESPALVTMARRGRAVRYRPCSNKSLASRTARFSGQTCPAAFVIGMPRTAPRTRNPATRGAKFPAMWRWPSSFTYCISVRRGFGGDSRFIAARWFGRSAAMHAGLVSGDCAGTVALPGFGVLAGRSDRCGTTGGDGTCGCRRRRWR